MSFIGAPPRHKAGTRPGFGALAASGSGGVTRLADLAQFTPLRILFPRVPDDEPLTACLTNTAGGVVGGDEMRIEARSMEGARLLLMAQAAEKIYRSAGETAKIEVALTADSGSWLE